MGNFGTTEIILIAAILLLLFGATLLPKVAKSLGQTQKALRRGFREEESTIGAQGKARFDVAKPEFQVLTSPLINTANMLMT